MGGLRITLKVAALVVGGATLFVVGSLMSRQYGFSHRPAEASEPSRSPDVQVFDTPEDEHVSVSEPAPPSCLWAMARGNFPNATYWHCVTPAVPNAITEVQLLRVADPGSAVLLGATSVEGNVISVLRVTYDGMDATGITLTASTCMRTNRFAAAFGELSAALAVPILANFAAENAECYDTPGRTFRVPTPPTSTQIPLLAESFRVQVAEIEGTRISLFHR